MTDLTETIEVRVTDSSLRDGSHAVRHRFGEADVKRVVAALDRARVPVIEVTHGDGLGGSSFTYGRSATDERLLIRAAADSARNAKIAVLMLPGIATMDDMRAARDCGASVVRIATHCTEADISIQHFGLARDLGLETVGFLMMAHSQPPAVLALQARIMADAGAECVYVTDSAGALVLEEVADRVAAIVAELGPDAEVGFHGHENLSVAVANTVAAIRAGARQVDGCTRSLGAGAGNTPTEVLVAVLDKLGIVTGIDTLSLVDVAEDIVRPLMDEECT
ncbi:MAG: 4-hydroxy-2-oxovalerate aldolase, partial [Acidimicrobiales bacterium]